VNPAVAHGGGFVGIVPYADTASALPQGADWL
jgi:hypothetical protein